VAELLDAVEGEVEAHANSRALSYPDSVSFVATSTRYVERSLAVLTV
jgi:hypothetical protein